MIEFGTVVLPATMKYALPMAGATGAGLLAVDTTTVTVTVIGAFQALILAWFGLRQVRNEQKTEQTKAATEGLGVQATATDKFVDQLQEQLRSEIERATQDRAQIAAQAVELGDLRRKMTDLEVGVIRLTAQLEAENLEPVWTPESGG